MKKAAYLAFALLGVIWGSNFIFMKWAAEDISPSQIVLLRVVFGFLPIFLFAPAKRALRWEHIREQYANIEEPKTAQIILSHPNSPTA